MSAKYSACNSSAKNSQSPILSLASSAKNPQPGILSQEPSGAGVFSQEFCEDSPVGILDQGSLARSPQSESTARGLQPATLSQKNPQAKVSSDEFSAGNPQSGILSQESSAKSPSHRPFVWEKNPWQQLTVTMTYWVCIRPNLASFSECA